MRLPIHNELGEILHLGTADQPKGVTVVFGGQAGSEGKGAVVGWLARRYEWAVAACTFMPNAGHTFVEDDGSEVVVCQLPQALVSKTVSALAIGASAVINVTKLFEEIGKYDARYGVTDRLSIHPLAQVMLPEYIEWEAEHLKYIASTGKGCGAAIAAKVRREQGVILAGQCPELKPFVRDDFDTWMNDTVNSGGGVLAEQSQGFDLDLNHGIQYPYCTSRQCTPSQICADLALEARLLTNSIAVVRTFPIKVGNADGHSGKYVSKELDWNTVSLSAGRAVKEMTTVTKRVRRVFEFDYGRITLMSAICRPTAVALTFADYIDPALFEVTQHDFEVMKHSKVALSEKLMTFVYKLEKALSRPTMNPKVRLVKTGPQDRHTINFGLSL